MTAATMKTGTNQVPVVQHVFTDNDLGLDIGKKTLVPLNVTQIVKLLKDPHSATLYDRHLHAIRKLCRHYEHGFLIKDLVQVCKILNLCADRLEEQPLYLEAMLKMIELCQEPFLNQKMSDVLSYEQIGVESLSQLGYLMRVDNTSIRRAICKSIVKFYTAEKVEEKMNKFVGHRPNRAEFNKHLIESSDVAETLVKSLALIDKQDTESRSIILQVLNKLSKSSSIIGEKMLNSKAAYNLASTLNDIDDAKGTILFCSLEILWNLLENCNQQSKDILFKQLNFYECIQQLRDAFLKQLSQGYSHYDRQLRNDLLVVCSLIAENCPTAPFLETGFVKQLNLLGTFQEIKSHNVLVKHLKFSSNHEDFELKKLILNLLVLLSKDECVLPLYTESRLLLALFSYVKPINEKFNGERSMINQQQWTIAQYEEIQLHAMSCLVTLSPLLIDDFQQCQGTTRLLLLLEWCIGSENFSGSGNGLHANGGRGTKKSQMRYCLRIIRSIVCTNQATILQDFVDQGAISQILSILNVFCQNCQFEYEIDIGMQTDMLNILAILCDNDIHRQELIGKEGVKCLIPYLKLDLSTLDSGLGHHQLLISSINCVWSTIIGCALNEDLFLEMSGVYLLLDLLENTPQQMANSILGCLLDLTENQKTISHLNTWRGNMEVTIGHLLCRLWREEEKCMGVLRDERGALLDLNKPLDGIRKTTADLDVFENIRAKIYAIFCKIGFAEISGLNNEDHITLTIVEHYYDFQVGRVWNEIQTELETENVRPVTPDLEILESINRICADRNEYVKQIENQLIEAEQQQDDFNQQEFFNELRSNQKQNEKALNDFHDYVMRTSNYQYLTEAKAKQQNSIEISRIKGTKNFDTNKVEHKTAIDNLNSTVFASNCQVLSTPVEITGGHLQRYDTVSGSLLPRDVSS